MTPLLARRAGALAGTARPPGDKSISHRALMLGAVAVGRTSIAGLLEGEDVLATAAAMRALGARVERGADGTWRIDGVGVGGLAEPAAVLDMGNSGTAARLLAGLLATHDLIAFMTGDASLCSRPMARVTAPLAAMGARFASRRGGRLPMAILGTPEPVPIRYVLPVASAQVKSAVLLAGLNTPGTTIVVEPAATRDHTETMLAHFGADIATGPAEEGGQAIALAGQPELVGRDIAVPADISSAAFPMVAAAIAEEADIVLAGVGVNPRRTGLLTTLLEMGAAITLENARTEAGEPVADIRVQGGGRLAGVDVPASRAPSMIDEYPILAVAAALARGTTHMAGLAELRVKESDRLAAMAEGLAACGVRVEAGPDSLTVHGTGRPPRGGAAIATRLDHRIAMSFLVLGTAAAEPVGVDDAAPIETSFPGFAALMNALGAAIGPPEPPPR